MARNSQKKEPRRETVDAVFRVLWESGAAFTVQEIGTTIYRTTGRLPRFADIYDAFDAGRLVGLVEEWNDGGDYLRYRLAGASGSVRGVRTEPESPYAVKTLLQYMAFEGLQPKEPAEVAADLGVDVEFAERVLNAAFLCGLITREKIGRRVEYKGIKKNEGRKS